MLLHVPEVLDGDEVGTLRSALDASQDWVDGRETMGAQGAMVKRNEQLAETSALREQLGARIQAA